jgi:hypothetical protein
MLPIQASCHRARFLVRQIVVLAAIIPTAIFAGTNPKVFLFSAKNLEAAQASLARGEPELQPALALLRKEADAALKMKPLSVMDKPRAAPGSDKHDYFSYGPYWWPDPSKPDRLPYIRRDGQINPDSKKDTDDHAWGRTAGAIETLCLAYFFTHHESYAAKAVLLARVWFLDPDTRMNPNMDHAQAVPGINNGRGIGLIETRNLPAVVDSLALLATSPSWTDADQAGFKDWLEHYFAWLLKSANGIDEHRQLNNHGTWYDVQAAYLALALGKTGEAKEILTTGLKSRLSSQVEPDGSQPRELVRTKSFEYSLFNLEALLACAQLSDKAGVDWWNFSTHDGRSLHAALAYLAPYANPEKPWPKKDLVHPSRTRLLPLFAIYLDRQDDPEFRQLLFKYAPTDPAARWHLLWDPPAPLR